MKKYFYSLLPLFLLFLAACNSQNVLHGTWVGIDDKGGTIEFLPDNKVIVDGVSNREYELSGKDLLIKWLSFTEEYKIEILSKDTLVMTGFDVRRKFIRESVLGTKTERLAMILKEEIRKIKKVSPTSVVLREVKLAEIEDTIHFSESMRNKIDKEGALYLGEVIVPKSPSAQVIVREGRTKGGLLAPIWEETYESILKNMITESIKKQCKTIKLKAIGAAIYDGAAIFEDNKVLNFTYDKKSGWLPKKDQPSIEVFTEAYFLNRFGTHTVKRVRMTPKPDNILFYEGEVEFSGGEKVVVVMDLAKSWLPTVPNDLATAQAVASYRFTNDFARTSKVLNIKQMPAGDYQVELQVDRIDRPIKVIFDANQGWYPVNEPQNLSEIIKCQMSKSANTVFVEKVDLIRKSEKEYIGVAYYSSKDRKDIKVICDKQKFSWEIIGQNAQSNLKSQVPPELLKQLEMDKQTRGPRKAN